MSGHGASEIITLQFGNYSNFVGAHLFELQNPNVDSRGLDQDEFDPNVLWREHGRMGGSSSGIFTPRALMIDVKENCISKAEPIAIAAASSSEDSSALTSKLRQYDQSLWDGKTERINQYDDESISSNDPPKKEVKRLLGNGQESWVDIPKWKLTPDHLITLPNYSHNQDRARLSSYSQGVQIWTTMEEHISNAIRKYAEESDNLQGFHMFVDEEDGFSGMGAGVLQHISDEYDKKSCFGLGLSPPSRILQVQGKGKEFKNRVANTALLWNSFNNNASIFTSLGLCHDFLIPSPTPINLPFLTFQHYSVYESSSIIAAALDTLISPYRRKSPLFSLPEFSAFLNRYGRKMTAIGSSLPFPFEMKSTSFFSTLKRIGFESVRSLTPGVNVDFEKATGNYFVVRGVPSTSIVTEKEQRELYGFQQEIKTAESCAQIYCNEAFPRCVNIVREVSTPAAVAYPFPSSIFNETVLNSYSVQRKYAHGVVDTWGIPVVSSAHNSPAVGNLLERLVIECGGGSGSSTRSINAYFGSCDLDIEGDDLAQCIDNVTCLRENYSDSFGEI